MSERPPLLAKFARPNTSGVLLRQKLFEKLHCFRDTPVVWVHSPAGAGKTTLISSYLDTFGSRSLWYQMDEGDVDPASFFYYLKMAVKQIDSPAGHRLLPPFTPEFTISLPLFTRRFFETLFMALSPEHPVVFDNYQLIDGSEAMDKAIASGLAAIPPGGRVFVISRSAPSGNYARLKVSGDLAVLTWDDLKLTLEESLEIARIGGHTRLGREHIVRLHQTSEGWAAGLILLLELRKSSDPEAMAGTSTTPSDHLFDYFAGEVFESMQPQMQNLLLRSVYLPKVHARHAVDLTGDPNAGEMLRSLSRHQYFVTAYSQDEPLYQYHQLFRQFLAAEAKRRIEQSELSDIQNRSARLLLESANIEEAASLYIQTEAWRPLIDLILPNAENLVTNGRHDVLAGWIRRLPSSDRMHSPWLIYWMGICRLITDPFEARHQLQTAFELFSNQQDVIGMYAAWAGVIDTFIYAWGDMTGLDPWIESIQPILDRYPPPDGRVKAQVTSAMFCALMYRRPQHQEMELWEERVKQIILSADDAELKIMLSSHLMLYYTWWVGGQQKAAFLVDVLQHELKNTTIAPLHYIVWRSIEGGSLWMRNHFDESLKALSQALDTAAKTGIHLWDFMLLANLTYWHLCRERFDEADGFLRQMQFILHSGRDLDISHFHFLSAYARLCRNELSLAMEHIDAAITLAKKAGCPYVYHFYLTAKADILIESGDYTPAEELLFKADAFGRQMRSANLTYQFSWLNAHICLKRGDRQGLRQYLRSYLGNSRANSTVNHAWWRNAAMAPLLSEALQSGIEVEHVKRLIKEHDISAPVGVNAPESWPYAVAITTLGPFSLKIEDQRIALSTMGRNKPLEMLKALAAFKKHGVRDSAIADRLWPDVDGDRALQNFTVTLHRLRKLIGYPKAILLKARQVYLDPKICWVDWWELDGLLDHAEGVLSADHASAAELQRIAEGLSALYMGPFLAEEQTPWAIEHRRKLHERWAKIVRRVGRSLEREQAWTEALAIYAHALDLDATAEWACQGALRCGAESRLTDDALNAYRRFKEALTRTSGRSPSQRTESLRKQLPG